MFFIVNNFITKIIDMLKYRLSKVHSLREESPLSKIDFNRPKSISREHFGKAQPEDLTLHRVNSQI